MTRLTGGINLNTLRIDDGLVLLLKQKRHSIDEECHRFIHTGDAEALHDLRVAMRRLHSLFSAFSSAFVPETDFPKQLRRLQKMTNPARDLEVSLALLEGNHLQLEWLAHKWQKQLDSEYRRLRRELPQKWQHLSPLLDRPIDMLRRDLPVQNLGYFAAGLLAHSARRLKKRRRPLCLHWEDNRAHKLRIIGKQVRYLLEPFADEMGEVASAVEEMKGFQELLGDYHDIVILRDKLKELERTGSREEARQLREARNMLKGQRKDLRRRFLQRHCGSKGKQFTRQLTATRKALEK